ncbi:phospholipid-transporting ATPase, partial [Haematococcus lacustris]
MTYVYFAFLTAFSSQPLYTTGLIATLNLCWASLPIIAYALFEQDVSNSTVMANPTLYAETMNANRKSFFISQAQWLGLATWHSLVVFFLPVYSMSSPDEQGLGDDWVAVGCGCYVALVLVLNLRLAMRSRYWTWINHLLIWLSISLFFPFLWLYGLVWPVAAVDGTADMSWVVRRILASSRFWLAGVLLAPIMSLLLDFSLLSLRRHLKPQAFEVYQ